MLVSMNDRLSKGTTLGEFFVLEKGWVRWLLGLCVSVGVWLFLRSWGVGGWAPTIAGFVIGTAVVFYLDQKYGAERERIEMMPRRYTGPSGSASRYRCDLCGQEFPDQTAGFAHADKDHIEITTAEARAAVKPIASNVGWERAE
jgi:hypothetical protein